MNMNKSIRILINPTEKKRLKKVAIEKEITLSKMVRDKLAEL